MPAAPVAPTPLPGDVSPEALLHTLLAVSLSGIMLLRPRYAEADETTIVDFTSVQLNPAAQRMLQLPECPSESFLTLYPSARPVGVFGFYCAAFYSGQVERRENLYQFDGLDGYYRLVAQRQGPLLVVSFTDANDQPRSDIELALRESQAGERAALAQAQAQRQRFYDVLQQLPAQVAVHTGPEHVFTFVNERFTTYVPASAMLGRPVREAAAGALSETALALFDQVYQTGEVARAHEVEVQLTAYQPAAPAVFLDTTYLPLRDATGRIYGVLDFSYDVTEQVLARRRAEQLNQQLEMARTEAERQRGELVRVFEQAPIAIAVYRGPTYTIELANPTVARLWGRTQAQLIGKGLFEALPEVAGMGFEQLLDGVMATGVPYVAHAMEAQHERHGQLETVYWDFVYVPTYAADGTINGAMVVANEVTEQVLARQQLEERVQERTRQLAEQQGLLTQILGQVPAIIATLSGLEHRFTFFNERYQQLVVGRATLGQPMTEAVPELVEQGFRDLLDRVYQTGQPFHGQEIAVMLEQATGGASQQYFDFTYQPLHDAAGQVQGILLFAVNVTERVRTRRQTDTLQAAMLAVAQREAQQRQEIYQIFAQTPVAILLLREPDHRIDYFNPAFQTLFPPDEWPGGSLHGHRLDEVYPRIRLAGLVALLDKVYQTGESQAVLDMPLAELQPGSPRYVTFAYQAYWEQGRIVGVAAFVYDTTEQVQARQQVHGLYRELQASNTVLEATNDRLTRTNEDLDTFVYTASHDLKAPIANVEGLVLALRQQLPAEVQQQDLVARILNMMQDAVTRFQQTIGHLTTISQLQQLEAISSVDLEAIVADVRQDLAPLLLSTQATLTVDVSACPAVRCPPKTLRSVVYNLLSNALKYRAPNRRPLVGLRSHCADGWVSLDVQDNGLGLSEAQQAKLFIMFQRLHTHVEGSGVGLYMVKRLVENAGGRISVQSQPGTGSIFTVRLPA